MLTWAEKYDEDSYEAKHLIIAALVDRVEVYKDHDVKIYFKVTTEIIHSKNRRGRGSLFRGRRRDTVGTKYRYTLSLHFRTLARSFSVFPSWKGTIFRKICCSSP